MVAYAMYDDADLELDACHLDTRFYVPDIYL